MSRKDRRSSGRGQSSLGYLFGNSDELLEEQGNDQSKLSSPPVRNSGGGKSSLGYLFGPNALGQQSNQESKPSSPRVCVPPYGTDADDAEEINSSKKPPSMKNDGNLSPKGYGYHKDGENSKDFLMTGRPSTRVTTVPGGDSSLGYLFGDK